MAALSARSDVSGGTGEVAGERSTEAVSTGTGSSCSQSGKRKYSNVVTICRKQLLHSSRIGPVSFLPKSGTQNTHKRYGSSVGKLKPAFSTVRLSDISAERIEDYKKTRLSEDVEPAAIKHDLRVLRRMMRLAERKSLISRNPFLEVDFLKEKNWRAPHIAATRVPE
jgi:hypothetical protein